MKSFNFLIISLVINISSIAALAQLTSVSLAFRNYPLAGDLSASYKYEGMIWDHRAESNASKFSYWQLVVGADVDGIVEFAANYYPISFLRLSAAVGGTYRYYNIPSFNCNVVNCQGFLSRNRVGAAFLGAFGEKNEWLVIPEYNLLWLGDAQNSLPIGDESENLIGGASADIMDRYQILAGKKIKNQMFGIFVRQAQFRLSGQHNEFQVLLDKINWSDTDLTLGVGRYSSDLYLPGITFFALYTWHVGQSVGFF